MKKNPYVSHAEEEISSLPLSHYSQSKHLLQRLKGVVNYHLDRLINWADEGLVYKSLPIQGYHFWFRHFARWMGDIAFWLKQWPRSNGYYLKGRNWSVICISSEKTKNELRRILFPDNPQETELQRVFLWQIPRAIPQWLSNVDLVVLEQGCWQPGLTKTRYKFSIRPWLRQILDISSKEEVINRMHSERRRHWRKMSQMGYTFTPTQKIEDFDLFYHKMYVPYITFRHADRATISPYEIYKLYFNTKCGGLILIRYQEEPVAGVLCRAIGEVCHVGSLGIREGSEWLIQQELMLAIYWSTVEWAWQQQLKIVDWNHSRAWQADGVFRFKRYWGTQIMEDLQTHEHWSFLTNFPPTGLLNQLNEQGFILESKNHYYAALLAEEGNLPVDFDAARWQRVAHHDGLLDLLVISPGEQKPLSQFLLKKSEQN